MAMDSQRNYLRTFRKRLNLSQAVIAFISGCGTSAKICRYEREAGDPRLSLAIAYELIFGIPIREIFHIHYERQKQRLIRKIRQFIEDDLKQVEYKDKLVVLTEILSRISEN